MVQKVTGGFIMGILVYFAAGLPGELSAGIILCPLIFMACFSFLVAVDPESKMTHAAICGILAPSIVGNSLLGLITLFFTCATCKLCRIR